MCSIRLSQLATEVGGSWEGDTDPIITGAADIGSAGPGDITFFSDERYRHHLAQTRASAIVLGPGAEAPVPILRAADPYRVFAAILQRFAPPTERLFPPGIHPTAVIDATASLDGNVSIGPCAIVGAGVRIGDGSALGAHVVVEPDAMIGRDCVLHAQVVVRQGCRLGDRVLLHAGAVIGSDGFGFLPGPDGLRKIPQIGTVVLEDDVEIGANSCIDRATTGRTVIGAGTKIDNLVQIGHNVAVGRNSAISAQTGISGSCEIGNGVTMGGQVGVADHRRIGDGASLAARSGIDRDIPEGQTVFGAPAVEIKRGYRLVALIHRLPEFAKRLSKLEKAVLKDESQEDK